MESKVSFGALSLSVSPSVYEPAEDSFLLATYASSLSGKILEIGCGCGIVSLSAGAANPKNSVLGVDLNPRAVECSRKNAEANSIKNCQFMQSDLFSEIPSGSKFDTILFNPPYLPTTREERLAGEENLAYDGGASGLETFQKFISRAPEFLAPGGQVAVIATSLEDGLSRTKRALEEKIGPPRVLASESFFFEKIYLLQAKSPR